MSVNMITILIPIYYALILILLILGIIILAKIIRTYFKNSKLTELKFKVESEDIKEIKERLNKIENILKDID
ncbi:hypothetical protein M1D49_05895 [Bacillus sp. PK3-056]|uniref:hypothetical protein n=1 Tax=Niallia circulans TaxID=1397 RepID=UPI000F447FB6|nr:hypothetical protein [Niallia circulans]AYV73924.1 hypothetical protein C2H98_21470 [Niallia circulans]UQZ76243.1 hypothetical protein C2I17_17725 [Niallia circulans]